MRALWQTGKDRISKDDDAGAARCAAAPGPLPLFLGVLLASCAVGPRYAPQPAPAVARYAPPEADAGDSPAAPSATTPGAADHAEAPVFAADARIDPMWWRGFGSADLDRLVADALAHNPDLRAAEETLTATREQWRASRGLLFPTADLALAASRQRPSPAIAGAPPDAYNLFTGQVQVGYDVDLFGLNRSLVQDARARLAIADNQLAAARLLIAGNVVQGVFRLASLTDQVQAMRKTVTDQQDILDLVQAQYRLGAVDQSAVLTQQSLLASSRAALTQLQQAEDAARHLLATYVGRYPAEAGALAIPDFAALQLPAELPLGLPSALVTARPDIRAAEAALWGANAEVGAAVARLYPNFRLDAAYGGAGRTLSDAVQPFNRLWDVAGSLLAPIFEGGRLRAEKRAAEASYRAMLASYQSTVLAAFRDVADVLRALQHDGTRVAALREASQSADAALALNMARYKAGGADYQSVLTSEVQAADARIALIEGETQRYGDTAALYVALGGGDWTAAGAADGGADMAANTGATTTNPAASRAVGE